MFEHTQATSAGHAPGPHTAHGGGRVERALAGHLGGRGGYRRVD